MYNIFQKIILNPFIILIFDINVKR